jgi:hypothetical protein
MIFLWNDSRTGYIIDLYSLQRSHSFRNFRYGSPTNLIMLILERNVLHSMQKGSWETYHASTTCRFCVRNISTYLRRGDDEVGNWPYVPPTLDITPFITLYRLHFPVHGQNEEEIKRGYRNLKFADIYNWCSSKCKGSSAEQDPSYVAYGNSASQGTVRTLGISNSINIFTGSHQPSLSWARCLHSTPSDIKLHPWWITDKHNYDVFCII